MRLRPYAGAADNHEIARIRESARAVDGDAGLPGPDTDEGPPEACWIAEVDGEAVGFTWLIRWSEDDGTEVFLIAGCVAPAHRGRGYGTALLRRQEAYAVSLGSGTGREVLAANADDTQPSAQELLLDNGFRPEFTVVSLSRPVVDVGEPAGLPDGIRTHTVLPRHQPQIYDAIKECFVGSGHGFEPLDYPGYLATVRDTDLWVVAWDADDVAGLVTNERQRDGSVDSPWVAVSGRRTAVAVSPAPFWAAVSRRCATRGSAWRRSVPSRRTPTTRSACTRGPATASPVACRGSANHCRPPAGRLERPGDLLAVIGSPPPGGGAIR